MRIKPYWNYFKYVMEHKKNVFIECWGAGLYKQAFTHDLSKLKPSEFIPYARYFYIDKEKYKDEFEKAWQSHYRNNPHHWDHHVVRIGSDESKWVCYDMSTKEVKEMICDWKAMSRKFGGTAQEFYISNYHKIKLSRETRFHLECLLELITNFGLPISECNSEAWMTLGELADSCKTKEIFNELLSPIVKEYASVDIYEVVRTRKED